MIAEKELDVAAEILQRSNDRGTVRVRGDSMRPTVRAGARVRVRFGREAPRRGDLVLFRQADYLVVHRVLGCAKTAEGDPCLKTRGDAAGLLDPPVDPGSVIGRVEAVERRGRFRVLAGFPSRFYALAFAAHGLMWGFVLSRTPRAIRRWVLKIDQILLTGVDALLFDLVHAAERPE